MSFLPSLAMLSCWHDQRLVCVGGNLLYESRWVSCMQQTTDRGDLWDQVHEGVHLLINRLPLTFKHVGDSTAAAWSVVLWSFVWFSHTVLGFLMHCSTDAQHLFNSVKGCV